jgi:glycerol-3-phosphate acyltransferase PlsY
VIILAVCRVVALRADMAMENLISLQSSGLRNIGEPAAPRPIGVQQGSVLVVLDVNKGVTPGAERRQPQNPGDHHPHWECQ